MYYFCVVDYCGWTVYGVDSLDDVKFYGESFQYVTTCYDNAFLVCQRLRNFDRRSLGVWLSEA